MKLDKVIVKKNPNGDTRTATGVPTYELFYDANRDHISDVERMMSSLSSKIFEVGLRHDWTKTDDKLEPMFYKELCKTIKGEMDFEKGEWYPLHCLTERHHLDQVVPKDVNLIDVLEMISDCVCAGMARSGEVRYPHISDEILRTAFDNTVEMCKEAVILIDDKHGPADRNDILAKRFGVPMEIINKEES